MCVRDPVARLWSQVNMRVRGDFKNEHQRLPNAGDVDEFNRLLAKISLEKLVDRKNFMSRSLATQFYQKWVDVFGERADHGYQL